VASGNIEDDGIFLDEKDEDDYHEKV